MKLGVLYTRVRVEEKWIFEALDQRVIPFDKIDDRQIGFNLADGSALTAFRLRRADGSALWSGGSHRAPGGPARSFPDGSVRFHKDGYTDLRGKFDYASLSTSDLDGTTRFSVLIMSDQHGATVKEVQPPKR